ncbi:hypothetical protein Tco_1097785 [Tanacetum coccineum]
MQQPMLNPEDIFDPKTAMNMALVAQSGVNFGQDRQMQMVGGNDGNQFRYYVVEARAKGNGNGNNVNQIRCYNCRGVGHLARNYTVRTRRRDAAYLQTQLDHDEIDEVNANCILMANLQHASTSGTQTDKALVYDSDGSVEQAQQKQQSLYKGKVLLEKHDPPVVYDLEETLQLAQESFCSQKAKSCEELYFLNTSKKSSVSKSISIPNEEFSDDTSPSVARKFLNKVKSTIVTFQRVVKQKMTLDIHNFSSSAHQELHKIVKDEIYPIVNQVDARVQNFEIQFLKEAAKFVRDFKSLANKADESIAKHKALEFKIERLLRVVFSQDTMSIVQNPTVVETSDL